MTEKKSAPPTEAELVILQVLWERGPSTVREVWDQVQHDRDVGYTTILKQMQVMTEKGLLQPNKARRSHVYRTQVTKEGTQRRMLRNLMKTIFRGSKRDLIVQALSNFRASEEELREIRKLLDRADRRD